MTLPLYVVCEQASGKVNGWTDVHVMFFESAGDQNTGEYEGEYRRFSKIQHPTMGEIRANEAVGRALLSQTFNPDQFDFNAVASLKNKQLSENFPRYVIGGRITVAAPNDCAKKLSPVQTMTRNVVFMPQAHDVSCRSVDRATAEGLFSNP